MKTNSMIFERGNFVPNGFSFAVRFGAGIPKGSRATKHGYLTRTRNGGKGMIGERFRSVCDGVEKDRLAGEKGKSDRGKLGF